MPAYRRSWWRLAATTALVVAACKDTTGPQAHLSDPIGFGSDLQTVTDVLLSPMFESFSAVSGATGSPVAAPSRIGALLRAAPISPPRTAAPVYAQAPARLGVSRGAATTLSSGISASVIADTLLGKTFVWDTATHRYAEDTTSAPPAPAPANGVRIILYQVDPWGSIIEPTVAVGFVDLLDESGGNTNTLHVIVKGGDPTAPGTTYANYTISGTVTGLPPNAFTATGNGFVSDGTHTLTFSAMFVATQLDTDNPDLQIDITWDLNNPAIHVELHETNVRSDASHTTITITEFSVTQGAERVSMSGTASITRLSPTAQTVTVDLVTDVNAVPWARISGTDDGIQIRQADGGVLSLPEYQAFLTLFALPAAIEGAIVSLFGPAESLMGA
jgi:hypothetical protein